MKTTIIEIDQDILPILESWHGGQWTAAYAVVSSIRGGNEFALDKDTVGRAINEYEREYDYTKMSAKDKRELGYAIEVLKAYYNAMPDDGSESEYEGEEIEEMTVWEPDISQIVPIEKAKRGDMVEVTVGIPWPSDSKKENVTGKVVHVKSNGMLTVDVAKTRDNPGGHSNEDVHYVDIRLPKKS